MSNQVAALESLAAEIEVVWGPHSVGAEPMPPVVIARAGSQWSTHVAPTLPNDIRHAVCAVTAGLSDDFAESLFDTLDPVLAPVTGTLRREVTLSYDCSRPASVIPPVGVRLITRADADTRRLRIAPDWGTQSDWEQILDNEFPWAAATEGNQVLSICETAR